ncbi:MAG: M6 family metalloprotease domain-containing protein [Clostridia bacterium]|nr:M6 family metalloprotease domain-containing protein [Clostridia bacterium]
MRQFRLTAILLATLLLFGLASTALAVPAFPGVWTLTQPDGTTRKAYMRGDEFASYYVDIEGVLLKQDAEGFYRQVRDKNGRLVREDDADFSQYLPEASPLMQRDNAPIALSAQYESGLNGAAPAAPMRIPCLVLAIQFAPSDGTVVNRNSMGSDGYLRWPWLSYPASAWSTQMFGPNDSMAAYYRDVSNGKLSFEPVKETDTANNGQADDGVVTITVNANCAYYDALYNPWRKGQIIEAAYGTDIKQQHQWYEGFYIKNALKQAEQYVDFASYDKNGNGVLETNELVLYCPIAGYEMSATDQGPATWAIQWNFYFACCSTDAEGDIITPETYAEAGGMTIKEFTTAGECYDGISLPRGISSYATACHELGHVLGLPDLYNTYGTPTPQNVNLLSLMAGGNWGFDWREEDKPPRPTYLDAWSKTALGFFTPETAEDGKEYTLCDASQPSRYSILRIDTADPDEYYLLENRQYAGYDRYLSTFYAARQYFNYHVDPLHEGVVVWHIRDDVVRGYDMGGTIRRNAVNTADHPYGVMPVFLRNDNEVFPFRARSEGSIFTFALGGTMYGRLEVLDESGGAMRVRYTKAYYDGEAVEPPSAEYDPPAKTEGTDADGKPVTLTQQVLPPYDPDYGELAEAAGDAGVFAAYTLNAADYSGVDFPLSVSFHVGTNYAGETFTVLHKTAAGKVESLSATVDAAGKLTVTVRDRGAAFMLLYGTQPGGLQPALSVPATGEAEIPKEIPWVLIILLVDVLLLRFGTKKKK